MFRCRMLRQGGHQVKSRSLSGSRARPRSTRPREMMRSSRSRSSGSWPIASGFRSFGCTSISVRATFRSPHSTIGTPEACMACAWASIASRNLSLAGKSLPPLWERRLANEQPDARVTFPAVPVAPVAVHLAEGGRDLIGRSLDLLQAENIRLLPRGPLFQLGLPRANAVHVPGDNPVSYTHLTLPTI